MKFLNLLVIFIIMNITLIAQPEPSRDVNGDATFTDDGIWHKNMELICPVNFDTSGQANEMVEFATINSNSGDQFCYIGSFNHFKLDNTIDYSYIRLDNLTDPRTPNFNFRRIYIENDGKPVSLGQCSVWDSGTEVFAVCVINDNNVLKDHITKIKAIIINLTELINWGENEVIVTNLNNRSKTFDDIVSLNSNSNIYLGYIESIEKYFKEARCDSWDRYRGVHTMTIDKVSSVLTFNHLVNSKYWEGTTKKTDAFVDVVVLDGIPGNTDNYYGIKNHPYYNSTTNPIVVSRLLKDGKPIRVTRDAETTPADWPKTTAVHETHAERIKIFDSNGNPTMETETNKISLALACASKSASLSGCDSLTYEQLAQKGGYAIVDIDYSSPFNCGVTFQQWWNADPDRENPNFRTSPETFGSQGTGDKWAANTGHTIEPVHIDLKNHFFVTMQELAAPSLGILVDNSYFPSTFSNSGGAYISEGTQSLNKNSLIYDDRRISNNLKLWGGDRGHHFIRGVGSENQSNPSSSTWNEEDSGPLTAYDVLEQSVADRNVGNYFPVQHIDDVADIVCTPTTNDTRAPNTIHHVRTHYGSSGLLPNETNDYRLRSELYIGAYAGGARVTDIKNFIRTDAIGNDITYTKDTIFEGAYFDYMPTLNYNPDSRYFYMLGGRYDFFDQSTQTQYNFKYHPSDIGIINYYDGVFDLFPDSRRTGLENDEDFAYALCGPTGKQAPFCQKGGYMILRYFRDEIGGIISGNNPTSPTLYQDMVFRKVNLQGNFKVQRDVTIASGAEVWLMPGEEGSGKTHDDMEFVVGDNGEKTVYVDGTLHISIENGNEGGSNIGVDVPIIVREGGKLYIHNIRDAKNRIANIKKKVTVQDGGLLEVTENAKVILNELFVDDGGQFIVKDGAEVTFDGLWHLNYGVAKFLGTSGNPITISAEIPYVDAIGLDLDEMNNYMQFYFNGGNNINQTEDEVYIEHTIFKGVHIRCDNKNITKVEYNEFYDDTDKNYAFFYNSSIPIFFGAQFEAYLSPSVSMGNPIFTNLNINNNIFKDLGTSTTTLLDKFVDGVTVSGNYDLTLQENTFQNHRFGANVNFTKRAIANQNSFTNMFNGLSVSNTGGRICDNTFSTNVNAVVYNNDKVFTVYDNVLSAVYRGMTALDGENQNYRNNQITNYVAAIYEENSIALLRGVYEPYLPICMGVAPFTLLGRNNFNNGAGTILTNPYIGNQLDPKRSDIYLKHKEAIVYMDCGYNDLSIISPNHIYYEKETSSDPDKTVDGNNNKWNDIGGYIPRTYNVNVTGANLDQSETTIKSCDEKNDCSCKTDFSTTNDCLNNFSYKLEDVGNWIRISSTDSADTYFDDKFDFYYNNIMDISISQPCRKNFALNLMATAVYGDSSALKITLVNSLLSNMYKDTTYSLYERINLGYVLAEGFERVGEIDSAINVLLVIKPLDVQTYTSRADWDIDRLKSLQFTDIDSLQYYNQQYLYKYSERLKLRVDTSGVVFKTGTEQNYENISGKNELFDNSPNPFSEKTEIKYYLSEDDIIKLSIISETGKEILVPFEGEQSKGLHKQVLSLHNLSSGVYFYKLNTSKGMLMKKMNLIK